MNPFNAQSSDTQKLHGVYAATAIEGKPKL
jgi:hypothetical protein